eukprot:TRINITY_DN49550_c0_g1_i1.p1 TRINITY_DN49550_c0_g1~~TRINITY_DN49550_c0_g1_i1.p1  ORF type:complete len:917 (-),score=105.89 TRINITY_DN49550_c0_g1_i1:56-2806(-)
MERTFPVCPQLPSHCSPNSRTTGVDILPPLTDQTEGCHLVKRLKFLRGGGGGSVGESPRGNRGTSDSRKSTAHGARIGAAIDTGNIIPVDSAAVSDGVSGSGGGGSGGASCTRTKHQPKAPSDDRSRALHSISRFGAVANVRASEAFGELVKDIESEAVRPASVGGHQDNHILGATKAFDFIVAGIEAALEGGYEAVKTVKEHEVITDTVPMHAVRHYKVVLPTRPTAVTVTVTRTAGTTPALWGSTRIQRPSQKDYDLKGKDDKLVYEHAIKQPSEDEDRAYVDRRHAVPKCRELCVTVEGYTGESTYRLVITFGYLKIVLSRHELSAQVQAIKRGWEVRVAEVQRDQVTREQFDERVKQLRYELDDRNRKQQGMDFVARNVRSVQCLNPEQQFDNSRKKALLFQARQEAVATRREDHIRDVNNRKTELTMRSDSRKIKREQEDIERREHQQLQDVQRAWFARLALACFTVHAEQQWRSAREYRNHILKEAHFGEVILRLLSRISSWKRRRRLYKNAIRLRFACAAYVRTMKPVTKHMAQPVICQFIGQHAFHREVPTLRGTLARFRSRVISIQRKWRKFKTMRLAFVDVLFPHWMDIQQKIYTSQAEIDAFRDHQTRQTEIEMNQSAINKLSAINARKVGQRRTLVPRSILRSFTTDGTSSEMNRVNSELYQVPEYIVRLQLYEYVMAMQKGHAARVQKWLAEHENDDALQTVANSKHKALDESSVRLPMMYLDEDELEVMVQKCIDLWKVGAFVGIEHHRLRLLKITFSALLTNTKRNITSQGTQGARCSLHGKRGSSVALARRSILHLSAGQHDVGQASRVRRSVKPPLEEPPGSASSSRRVRSTFGRVDQGSEHLRRSVTTSLERKTVDPSQGSIRMGRHATEINPRQSLWEDRGASREQGQRAAHVKFMP